MYRRLVLGLLSIVSLLPAMPLWAAEPVPVHLLDLESVLPASWDYEQPTSTMRLLQYRVPGAAEGENASFVVYYFGPGQGGSNEANIERWKSQFTAADGGPAEPVITTSETGELPVTLVALRGSYARSIGIGQQVAAQPDQTPVHGASVKSMLGRPTRRP